MPTAVMAARRCDRGPTRAQLVRGAVGAAFGDARVPRLEDAWQRIHPAEPQPPTLGVHDRDEWPEPFACDFIFVTSDLRGRLRKVAVDASTEASDHQPMLVELG